MKKHYYHEAIISLCTHKHLTTDEIFFSLKKKFPQIGIATVYRNVKSLTEIGKLTKVTVEGKNDCYEANHGNHGHIVDTSTGTIQDIDIPQEILDKLSHLANRPVEKLELTLYVK